MTTTDTHPTDILVPRVLWAQRKDRVYVTIEVFGVKDEKLVLTEGGLQFNGTRSDDNAKFAVSLEFYAPVDVEKSQKQVTPRNVSLVLHKQDSTAEYWPRLIKGVEKLHYIAIDFSKWVDEDEEGQSKDDFMGGMGMGGMGGMGDFSNFDPSQFGNMNYDDDNEDDDGELDLDPTKDGVEEENEDGEEKNEDDEEKNN